MIQCYGGNDQMFKVAKNLRDEDGKCIVKFQNNPLHNTELYEFKYHKVKLSHIEANIIVMNILHRLNQRDITSSWWIRFSINIAMYMRYPKSKDSSSLGVEI